MERFVERLAKTSPLTDAVNPYARNWSKANAVRRHNLLTYLRGMLAVQPRLLLVGEALGYRGGGVTGVPFVSETLLLTHPRYANWDFRPNPATSPQAEASATIVQAVCDQLDLAALHWNAFPFHPHRPGNPLSNRKPTAFELTLGKPFLLALIAGYDIETVVAVGNSAEKSLTALNIPHRKVRHPSHGGKSAFRDGLLSLTV